MKKVLVAVDVQDFYRPSQGMVHQINQMVARMPIAATLFVHDEAKVPYARLRGKPGAKGDTSLIKTPNTFVHHGFGLPRELFDWLRAQGAEQVVVAGGHTDANVLAAGFSLFDAGFQPVLVPVLCYGNEWYMHSVTSGIWEQSIGPVYQSVAELN